MSNTLPTNTPIIEVPRAWLERLVELEKKIANAPTFTQKGVTYIPAMDRLRGFVESAEYLLK